ncbi:hypothetical protein VNI00_002206 [Paramarasmius palmivorus]|uniref:F-box domain-containing protein n=1 Tax=Paramarasmius palmivorus TaxID=297713 RepID=A0AAW0E4F0_9AGAR
MSNPPPSQGIDPFTTGVVPPSPEVKEWCLTNIRPPHTNIQIFKSELGNIRERRGEVARSMAEKEQELMVLREEDELLQTYAETYEMILHPMRHLPDAVLCEIFNVCVDDQLRAITNLFGVPSYQNSLHPLAPPWTLSQVCHRWRDVALSCSSLWSRISFGFSSNGFLRIGPSLERLILQLQRSKNCPLAVTIYGIQSPQYPINLLITGPYLSPLSPLLISLSIHSNRWETLHISISSGNDFQVVHRFISAVKGKLQTLRHLSLSLSLDCSVPLVAPGQPLVIDGLGIAPKLESFGFHGANDPSRYLELPWNQITHLRVHWPDVGYDYMQSIHRMSKLRVWVHIGAFVPSVHPPPFLQSQVVRPTLEHLHHLYIFPSYPARITRSPLDTLTAPNLQILCLTRDSNRSPGIYAFLTRVAPTLRSLYLDLSHLTIVDIERMLRIVSNLQSLHVSSASEAFTAAMGASLVEDSKTPCLVPDLRELGIFYPYEFSGSTFLQMVKFRIRLGSRASQSRLQRFLYDGKSDSCYYGIDEITEQQLLSLRSDTFEVDDAAKPWFTLL